MELLLILSAMLTALTGAMTGARAVEAQTQQNVAVAATQSIAATALTAPAYRSWLALAGGWIVVRATPIAAIVEPVRTVAIHMDKRRE